MHGWIFSANPKQYDLHSALAGSRPPQIDWQIGSTQYLDDIVFGDLAFLNQVGGMKAGQLLGFGMINSEPYEETVLADWVQPLGYWDPADLGKTFWFVDFIFTWLKTPVPYSTLKADPDFAKSLFIRSGGRSNPTPADHDDCASLLRIIGETERP